jgi:hypothetical protein
MLTFFRDAFDRSPGEWIGGSWDDLCNAIAEACGHGPGAACVAERGDKRTLPALLPARTMGPRRAHTDYVSAMAPVVVIDVDAVAQDALEDALATLDGADAIVYASPSDSGAGADTRRVRIIVHVDGEYDPAQCARARLGLARMLGVEADTSALEPERLFFVGCLYPGDAREVWRTHGGPVPLDMILAEAPAEAGAPRASERGPAADQPLETAWPSDDAREAWLTRAAAILSPAWAAERQSWALQMLGWTARYMTPSEHTDLLWALQDANPENHHKFLQMAERVEVLAGPSQAIREALGAEAFAAFDAHLATHPNNRAAALAAMGNEAFQAAQARRELVSQTPRDTAPPAAPAAPATVEILPKAIEHADLIWLRDPSQGNVYEGPWKARGQGLRNAIRDMYGAEAFNDRGKRKAVVDFLDEQSLTATITRASYTAIVNSYDPRDNSVTCATLLPCVHAARYDADVEAWITALFENDRESAYEWIRSLRRDLLGIPAVALCLRGEKNCGKTLFAQMCARVLGASSAVPLANVARQFNSSIEACPIVLDDECRALKSRKSDITTDYFREMVAACVQHSEAKGKDIRPVVGALRMIFTANADEDFRFSDAHAGPAALRAVADRLAHYVADDAGCARALDRLRGDYGRADEARIVGHLAWIMASGEPARTNRFLGKPRAGAAAAERAETNALEAAAARHPEVFEILGAALEDPANEPEIGEPRIVVREKDGIVFARITATWGAARTGDVAEALAPFRVHGGRTSRVVRVRGRTVRMWELSLERLKKALAGDAGAVLDISVAASEEA